MAQAEPAPPPEPARGNRFTRRSPGVLSASVVRETLRRMRETDRIAAGDRDRLEQPVREELDAER